MDQTGVNTIEEVKENYINGVYNRGTLTRVEVKPEGYKSDRYMKDGWNQNDLSIKNKQAIAHNKKVEDNQLYLEAKLKDDLISATMHEFMLSQEQTNLIYQKSNELTEIVGKGDSYINLINIMYGLAGLSSDIILNTNNS